MKTTNCSRNEGDEAFDLKGTSRYMPPTPLFLGCVPPIPVLTLQKPEPSRPVFLLELKWLLAHGQMDWIRAAVCGGM
jgi:hypothetical protein